MNAHSATPKAGLTFAELDVLPLFVTWRTERVGDRLTKVPYIPDRRVRAKSNDPATWGTRASAEAWVPRLANGLPGSGVGLMLGTLGASGEIGRAGVDLDTCRTPATGEIEPWAIEIIERFASYTEVSPSGTGVKVFFAYDAADLPAILKAMGTTGGKAFKRPGREHPPAIEIYLNGRYFALTGEALADLPADLQPVSLDILMWLIREAGPAFVEKSAQAERERPSGGREDPEDNAEAPTGKDKSRSAIAMRIGCKEKRRGATYEQMCATLLADPRTAEWARTKGAAAGGREFQRIWSRATACHGNGRGDLPTIRIIAGDLPNMVNQAESALLSANLGIYQRSTFLVRPGHVRVAVSDDRTVDAQRILPLREGALLEAFAEAANWKSYNAKAHDWLAADAPGVVVKAYCDRVGHWKLPVLAGLINAPTLRSDGSLLNESGYDARSGLLFDPCGTTFPPIPDQPTQQDARDALMKLVDLISTFPFVQSVDRSVALSAILTSCIRRSIPTAPLHGFTAPIAGSGKSMLVDLCSIIATGREAGVIAQGQSEEETEKRLGALLLAGETVVAIDNCDAPLVPRHRGFDRLAAKPETCDARQAAIQIRCGATEASLRVFRDRNGSAWTDYPMIINTFKT